MSDQVKFRVISRLLNGDAAIDIDQDEEEVSYATILRYKRELKEAQDNDTVHELMNLDKAVLEELLGKVKEIAKDTPLKVSVDTILDKLPENISFLADLSEEFKLTAQTLNARIRLATAQVQHVSELETLTDALCKLQNAFFNRNSTQVNVQNNYDSTGNHRYSNFTNDIPSQEAKSVEDN